MKRRLDEPGAGGLSGVAGLVGKENLELTSWASLGQPDVPAGTDLLVVAGARARFVEPELQAFGRFLDRGGRMLVLLDPELAPGGGLLETGLESWLDAYGVQVGANIVVDPGATVPLYGAETLFAGASGGHPIVRSLEQAGVGVIVALARSVAAGRAPEGAQAQVLLETTAEGWGESDLVNLRAVAKDGKDLAGPVPLAVAVSAPSQEAPSAGMEEEEPAEASAPKPPAGEGPAWRLVVVGDSDFATNSLLALSGNPTLLANSFNWLLDRQKLLGIGPKKPDQVRMTLTPGQLSGVTWLVLAGLPALAIAAGVAVLFPAPEVERMRPRSLLILALVVGVLLALIYYAEDRVAGTDERAAAAKRLVGATPEEIVALDLEWQGSRVRFERAGKSPESTGELAPGRARGESSSRSSIPPTRPPSRACSPRLAGLEAVRELDGVARRDVGLEPPRGSVSWTTATDVREARDRGRRAGDRGRGRGGERKGRAGGRLRGFRRRALPSGRRVAKPDGRGGDARPDRARRDLAGRRGVRRARPQRRDAASRKPGIRPG